MVELRDVDGHGEVGGAPPPPGTASPVPADASARAAAAGRAKRMRAPSAPRVDELVPTTALENRAQERASARRARLGLGVQQQQSVVNPGAGMPGQFMPPGLMPAVAESMPPRFVPAGWQQSVAYGPYPGQLPPAAAGLPNPAPPVTGPYSPAYAAHPHPYGAAGYGPAAYGAPSYGVAAYGAPAYGQPMQPMVFVAPRITWSSRQRSAALLSSWLGQTVMSIATHLLTAFFIIVLFAWLLHTSGGESTDFEADGFTSTVARWTMGDRVWATLIIGTLVGGALLGVGWLLNALWARSAGLAKPHRSTWLAWLCTTAATGFIGLMLWPFALMVGLFGVLMVDDASLTTGTMWSVLFWELGIAAVLTGGVGMLFGWLFLSQARPRVDYRAIAEAEEAAARARDEAELTEVQLRGAAPSGTSDGSSPSPRSRP